jgi:hypothetical protein
MWRKPLDLPRERLRSFAIIVPTDKLVPRSLRSPNVSAAGASSKNTVSRIQDITPVRTGIGAKGKRASAVRLHVVQGETEKIRRPELGVQ